MYENGDNLRHHDTAQRKYFKIHVLACMDWNVTKNLQHTEHLHGNIYGTCIYTHTT